MKASTTGDPFDRVAIGSSSLPRGILARRRRLDWVDLLVLLALVGLLATAALLGRSMWAPIGPEAPAVLDLSPGKRPYYAVRPLFRMYAAPVALSVVAGNAEALSPSLRLIRTIPLLGVRGRIDHLAVDLEGRRLFIAALGNGSLEVVDLTAGTRVRSVPGFHEPQGVLYIAGLDRIVVTGGDGACDILDGRSFGRIARIGFSTDADNVRYDEASGRVYVGYGDGALGVVDPKAGVAVGDIRLAGHPEAFQIDRSEGRIFVNVPAAGHVGMVDLAAGAVLATWPLRSARDNYPMALDEAGRRLFIGTRRPARLLVLDTRSGRTVAALESSGDADDLFYDARSRRIYLSGGEGAITVYEQQAPDRYRIIGRVRSAPGARTSLFVPEQDRLYVAAPARGGREAEILVYEVAP